MPVLPRTILAILLLGSAQLGRAQVMQVGEDGGVTVQRGPTVTTSAGGTEAIRPPVPGWPAATATAVVATAPPPAGLGQLLAAAARETGVDARLLHAVAWHESRFRQDVVSNKGAIGVMQIMPQTARWLGIDPRDVAQNVRGGAALLGRFLRHYGGDVALALAAYSAGPGAVRRYGGVPPFVETQNYVADIRRILSF